jgi:hypothetical protein
VTFDDLTTRAAALLDRRSVLGGVSGTLLTVAIGSPVAMAKKGKKGKGKGKKQRACRKRAVLCRQEFLENCEDFDVDNTSGCIDAINRCCRRAGTCKVKSLDAIFDQCFGVLCQFKSSC